MLINQIIPLLVVGPASAKKNCYLVGVAKPCIKIAGSVDVHRPTDGFTGRGHNNWDGNHRGTIHPTTGTRWQFRDTVILTSFCMYNQYTCMRIYTYTQIHIYILSFYLSIYLSIYPFIQSIQSIKSIQSIQSI